MIMENIFFHYYTICFLTYLHFELDKRTNITDIYYSMDKRRNILWDAKRYFFDRDIFFYLFSPFIFTTQSQQPCANSCSTYREIQPYSLNTIFSKSDNSTTSTYWESYSINCNYIVIQLQITSAIRL